MQRLMEARIEIDGKVTRSMRLPEVMILYAMDTEHIVIAAKPMKDLEEKAIAKTQVKVISEKNKHVILLPMKLYNFYRLEENDYTVMVSDKDPTTLIIAI